MDKIMALLKLLKTWAPLLSVLLLGAKTIAQNMGQKEAAEAIGMLMSIMGLGVFDPETSAATIATAGGLYKVWSKLKPAPVAVALLTLAFCGSTEAQTCPGVTGQTVQYASEAITVSSSSIGFTAATVNIAVTQGKPVLFAEVTLETNPIRVRADGTAPSDTVGTLWNNAVGGNVKFTVCGEATMRAFRMIRTGSDAAVTAVFYTSQ